MGIELYHLHPAVVHFPIALLALGAAVAGLRWRGLLPDWTAAAESWLLWLGTLAAWTALGLGLLAKKTAPHVPLAWEVLADHRTLGWWTCSVFSVLSCLRFFDKPRWLQLLLWAAGLALLIATAEHGGELVYGFAVGVSARGS